MKKLDLKYEPKLRRAAFIEWISQLEIGFRTSTFNYKNQGSKLLRVLHMKFASVDENIKLRAKGQFLSCKIGNEETALTSLQDIN